MSDAPELPPLPLPLARGASECHVLAVREGVGTMMAACGVGCGNFCGEVTFQEGMERCPVHQTPICTRCVEIVEVFARTGEWEGIPSNPRFGVPITMCLHRDCTETVEVGGCWCWEHLTTGCDGADCEHAAHYCEAPVHYCERHSPEAER